MTVIYIIILYYCVKVVSLILNVNKKQENILAHLPIVSAILFALAAYAAAAFGLGIPVLVICFFVLSFIFFLAFFFVLDSSTSFLIFSCNARSSFSKSFTLFVLSSSESSDSDSDSDPDSELEAELPLSILCGTPTWTGSSGILAYLKNITRIQKIWSWKIF